MAIVSIYWKGPYSVKKAVEKFKRSKDIGLYQLYGRHLVFGRDSLLYIGMTTDKFKNRIFEHAKEYEIDKLYKKRRWVKDVAGVFGAVYCGRLCTDESGEKYIKRGKISCEHEQQIKDAEKLLIYACSPPGNSKLGKIEDIEDKELHILNFGSCGSLPTEVSVPFWRSTKSFIRSSASSIKCYRKRPFVLRQQGGTPAAPV